jgi:hypothetical protein
VLEEALLEAGFHKTKIGAMIPKNSGPGYPFLPILPRTATRTICVRPVDWKELVLTRKPKR